MSDFKEYTVAYQRVLVDGKIPKLRAILTTSEFGPFESALIDAVADESVNRQLLDSLADDVINQYETKLSSWKRRLFTPGVQS